MGTGEHGPKKVKNAKSTDYLTRRYYFMEMTSTVTKFGSCF